MTRGSKSFLDSIGDATSGAGSEALAALSNLGGGGAGGTVGRVVSAVAGRHGGFAPKVITSVTKHGIAGIQRVEPLEGVDRGYRAVAEDANGLESIRTIIELDPREYEVTVTREEGAGVVEFVQMPEPDPEPQASETAVEPKPPVKHAVGRERPRLAGSERRGGEYRESEYRETGHRTVEPSVESVSAQPGARHDSDVERAKAEAEKARAEAEAEKARAEAETARAEAEAAKARARAEQARAEAETEAIGADPPGTPELDGGTVTREQPATTGELPGRETPNADEMDPAFSAPSVADGFDSDTAADTAESPGGSSDATASANDSGKWGVASDPTVTAESESATAVDPSVDDSDSTVDADSAAEPASAANPGAPLRTEEPLQAETGRGDADGEQATVVDDEFGSFVAADPVEEDGSEAATAAASDDDGIGRWASDSADDSSEETGDFEF